MNTAREVMGGVGCAPVLDALGLSRATFHRHRHPRPPARPRPAPARALGAQEQQTILDTLHCPRFVDAAPAQVVATLADEGTYLASTRTFYRLLAQHHEVRERRNQARHPVYVRPELVADAPNRVWTWDITKLQTFKVFHYLFLYVILDIYSRYVVGWMLAEHENAALARRLIDETIERQQVGPTTLVLHSDRGSPMRSQTVAQLLGQLGVAPSFSRPHVSNDNPFSESQFKTLKYHPTFPDRFNGLEHGRTFATSYFDWYNHRHHHSGLALLTPAQVHLGKANEVLDRRHAAILAAHRAHPERFVHGPPTRPRLPPAVYINPPKPDEVPPATPLQTQHP